MEHLYDDPPSRTGGLARRISPRSVDLERASEREGGRRAAPTEFRFGPLGFGLTSAILAAEPAAWLVRTWIDPSVQAGGALYAALLCAILVWSVSSPVAPGQTPRRTLALGLLLVACTIRLAGQMLAINVVGGVALALDVYAIATLLRVSQRRRAVSPFWLSVLFLFTLPVERIVQRIAGYPLQDLSARGAYRLLSLVFDEVRLDGVRLQVAGRDVLVDLPCSGTTGLMIALAAVTVHNALSRGGWLRASAWVVAMLGLSLIANIVRIALLAAWLAMEGRTGIDVMAEPLHAAIGLSTLLLSLLPLILSCRPRGLGGPGGDVAVTMAPPSCRPVAAAPPSRGISLAALALVPAALIIVSLPRHALDTSRPLAAISLPSSLAGYPRRALPLTPVEIAYFRAFGGQARKAAYGPLGLTVVRTTSPLRHLHAPDDCLRGLGYAVRFLGTSFSGAPTALYKAVGPKGDAWHVAVTFVSDQGHVTSNVAEAIWHWLAAPGSSWSSVQRVTPWHLADAERRTLEAAALAAQDVAAQDVAAQDVAAQDVAAQDVAAQDVAARDLIAAPRHASRSGVGPFPPSSAGGSPS